MINKCSCLILNYNDSKTTIKLLKSIRNFDVFEHVVVVDNCSTDNSYIELKKEEKSKIDVIRTSKNGGYGFGNNYGVNYIWNKYKSDYVLICNPDVIFDEASIKKMINIMNQDDKIGMVSGVQLDVNRNVISDVAWKIPTILEYTLQGTKLLKSIDRSNYDIDFSTDCIYEVDCVPGACFMINTKAFVLVKGYDENMFLFCEETVIGYKLKEYKYKTILDTSINYIHEHSVSINKSTNSKIKQRMLMNQSRNYFMKEYLKASKIQLFFASFIQKHVLKNMKKGTKL